MADVYQIVDGAYVYADHDDGWIRAKDPWDTTTRALNRVAPQVPSAPPDDTDWLDDAPLELEDDAA